MSRKCYIFRIYHHTNKLSFNPTNKDINTSPKDWPKELTYKKHNHNKRKQVIWWKISNLESDFGAWPTLSSSPSPNAWIPISWVIISKPWIPKIMVGSRCFNCPVEVPWNMFFGLLLCSATTCSCAFYYHLLVLWFTALFVLFVAHLFTHLPDYFPTIAVKTHTSISYMASNRIK